ncbi:MAG: M20/M25/M40 family metallo-hydrolase, partial [Spirochaetes bacterium]|nr:M20/M25/M40 family metallo-hydrolase [Spirochaetota bacterium]
MTDDISRWFEANIDSIARDILELVAVRSVSGDVAASRRALELALEKARSFGLSTRLEAEGRVGVAELRCDGGTAGGGEPETLGVLAHVDVVDPGDPASWSHDPWGELADGAVWGRGCVDDKGPLLICLWALRALRELGRPLRKNVSVIIGTMEEIDWEDLRAYKATGARLPDYGFTPDGAFPVTNREKGYCDVTLSFPADVHSGLGPWRIVSLEGGEAVNAVPEKAVAVLEETVPGAGRGSIAAALESSPATEQDELVVERIGDGLVSVAARGVATHSCFPGKGENAIVRLAGFLARLGPNGLAEFVSSRLGGDYLARGLGLQTRPEIVDGEYFGPTTVSPDLLSTAAGRFELTLNLRLA